MTSNKRKSKMFRRIRVKTIKDNKISYRLRNAGKSKCANCKTSLRGSPLVNPAGHSKLAKSLRTVSRPFGGNLCSSCSREEIFNFAKSMVE